MKDVLFFEKDTFFSQSEAQKALESFFQDSPLMLGIVELTSDDIIHLNDNPASAKFFGSTQAALRNQPASNLGVPRKTIDFWMKHYQEARRINHPVKFRESFERDNQILWFQVTVSFLGMAQNGRPRFSYLLEDISKIIEEENLRLMKEKTAGDLQFQMLADAMTQLAWIADAEGKIYWYNSRWYEYTGTTLEDVKGSGWEKVHHPDHLQRVVDFVTEAWKKPVPWELTFPLKSKSGEWRWFLTRAVPIKDSKGQILRWLGTNTDITEHQNLINEIEFQKSRFETVMKQMPAAVIIGEAPSGKLIFANEKMGEVWGHEMIPSADISEYVDWVGFHPDGTRYKGEDWPLARSIKHGEVVNNEDTPILRGDGKHAVLRLSSAPVRDREGNIVAGVVICQDVTESLRIHNTLKENEAQLKEAIIARDEFLSIASHELKTPLTSLILNGQMIKKQIQKDEKATLTREKVEKFVDHTNKQTARLTRLVDDMLEISRLRTGKLSVEKETVNLTELLKDLKSRFDELFIETTGEELQIEIGQTISGLWDKMRLEQTLSNLLTNALKYGNKKPVKITVTKVKNQAFISVIDQGIGIRAENKEKIFQRFERAGISANDISGLGLGLYIAKQIALAHDGTIFVESEFGKGSKFVVCLPIDHSTQSLGVDLHQN